MRRQAHTGPLPPFPSATPHPDGNLWTMTTPTVEPTTHLLAGLALELAALDDAWRRPSCSALCLPGEHTLRCDHATHP